MLVFFGTNWIFIWFKAIISDLSWSLKKLGGKLKNSNNHGGSAPNLATKETRETVKETTVAPASPEKPKSKIKKIFGKMKRSNSGYLYEDKNKSSSSANQQNGNNSSSNTNNGSRCSEGSRFSSWMMANGNNSQFSEPEMPFGQWTLDTLGLFLTYRISS